MGAKRCGGESEIKTPQRKMVAAYEVENVPDECAAQVQNELSKRAPLLFPL